ncbi:response regulator [Legionella donaldsonii]|uniref:response regulator n=1 Tax=Legionella donaldsonii TaxID=45060 RepID=UPI00399C7E37
MMSYSPLLIVEDDFVCQHIYLSLLNEYQPVLAATAAEALDCLSKQPFHCILLDLGLPDKPGEELLPLIRSNSLNGNTPVIVISAQVDEALGQQCLALGANHIYVKPVLPAMLRRMVESALLH